MPVFTANIPALLKVGDRIEIGGKIKENARKMSVNLCAQEGEEPRDVVLHFDVRFHRDNIISLSRKNGVWIGSGNYDTNYNMFVPGTQFRIVFEIKDTDVITIYCQGKFHSNFLPKIPLSMAKFMVAWADVERITHCYFHLNNKAVAGDDGSPGAYVQSSPRPMNNTGDCAKRCQPKVNRKPTPGSPPSQSAHESSDDDKMAKDRYFYDALLCAPNEHKFGIPEELKRREALRRNGNRNFRFISDPEKNDTEEFSEDLGKNGDSSQAESEDVLRQMGLKKRSRRGKFGPFAQMVNFMDKSKRKN